MSDKSYKILVVEDEELLLSVIQTKLKEAGFDVKGCRSGEEALNMIDQTNFIPDAVWLDYHLRGMDGLSFIKAFKADPRLTNIPVIVVSNSANDSTVQKLLEAGASKYLLKAQNRLEDIINIILSVFQ